MSHVVQSSGEKGRAAREGERKRETRSVDNMVVHVFKLVAIAN